MCFLPADADGALALEGLLEQTVRGRGPAGRSGGATCPVDDRHIGETAPALPPGDPSAVRRRRAGEDADQEAFERKLYVIRRVFELAAQEPGLYVCSSSSRTINYKGMLISSQLRGFYPDLRDARAGARWRSCTRASRPTRSRAGSSPTPTG